MTANELADEFENRESHWKLINYIHWAEQAETMLRQQQAEIEALHNLVKEQDMKIINLSFDVAYANRRDEWLNETDKQDE